MNAYQILEQTLNQRDVRVFDVEDERETSITKDGCHLKEVKGTPEEETALEKSYAHLCALRDEVIAMGVLLQFPNGTN